MDILSDGLFPALAREAFRLFRSRRSAATSSSSRSKNALAASPNAAAYCTGQGRRTASGALPGAGRRGGADPRQRRSTPTRCCAAPRSGPANGWSSAPRPTRPTRTSLEEIYRKRSMLKRSVFPEDIAEAVYFFASDSVGQVHRQHHQRRRRQRPGVHALSNSRPPRRQPAEGFPASQQTEHISTHPVEATTPSAKPHLRRDYDSPGRTLERRGIDIDAVRAKVAAFSVAVPSWGVGTGGTRFAQLPGRRRAARHLRQARGLRGHQRS